MIAPTPGRLNGTLILSGEGPRVQYSLQDIEIEFRTYSYGEDRIEISATPGGDHFVDLSDGRSEELTLLLELWSEQRRLGASNEALAATRDRIERHIKKETT